MLNTLQLLKIINEDKHTKDIFLGVFARDQLPKVDRYPACLIVNTDPSYFNGEHWLAMFIDKYSHCTFFDSYGNTPSKFRLETYMNSNFKSWSYNRNKIQGSSSYCGYYCALFLLFTSRNKLNQFNLEFNDSNNINDFKLTTLLNKF